MNDDGPAPTDEAVTEARGDPGRPRLVTDEQIFEALADAITKYGPHRWTLTKVAAGLGLTGPALGYRFGNKRNLLLAFAAHQPQAAARHFKAVADAAPSPRDAIVESLLGLVSGMTTRTEVANNIAMLSLDVADDELAEHARRQTRVIKAELVRLVTACGRPTTQAPEATAEDLYVVWSGAIISWAIDGEGTLADWTGRKLNACLDTHGV